MSDRPARPPAAERLEAPVLTPIDTAQRGRGPFFWRFNRYHRWTHAAVIISFFLLAYTGLPLRFSCATWAPALMDLLGGVEMAGLLHRVGAVITFAYFAMHIGFIIVKVVRTPDRRRLFWGPDSIVPQPHDVREFVEQFRWFFRLGPKPRFGRFSYMEKFDYFAVFWGVAIIGGSGLLLWFPEFFAGFLPGWVFNVAMVVHGEEALLATGFIFTIHFFNVHFRPDKFPLDAVMFHGRATAEYLEEEHPGMVHRLKTLPGEQTSPRAVPDLQAPPPGMGSSLASTVFGFLALGLGVLCVGLILWGVFFC
jgi:cytochrome b subunit of formate dehydrogenase